MSTEQPTAKDFKLVSDPVYSVTNQPINVDSSTSYRSTRIISADSNGTGTYDAPLNRTSSNCTFTIRSGGNFKQRWGTMALRMRFRFYGANEATAGDGTRFCPPYNLPAQMIDSISLRINSGGAVIYSANQGEFAPNLTARLLRYYSREALDNMSSAFFTPWSEGIDEVYSSALPVLDDTFDAGSANLLRGTRWIGASSHLRDIVKIIPFSILFPQLPDAVFKNMNEISINIQWLDKSAGKMVIADNIEPVPGLLMQSTANVAATAHKVCLLSADVLCDNYNLSASNLIEQTALKASGSTDEIAFMNCTTLIKRYSPGSSISISGVKNLDCVCILQPATSPQLSFNNGQVLAINRVCYTDPMQSLLFGNSAAAATTIPSTADRVPAAGSTLGISSAQIEYGSISFPSSPIVTNNGTSMDFSQLYYHYLQACAKATRRDVSPSVSFSEFKATKPFIMLRPWGDNAAHMTNQGQELLIKLTGGVESNICIVLFCLNKISIHPDGTMDQIK